MTGRQKKKEKSPIFLYSHLISTFAKKKSKALLDRCFTDIEKFVTHLQQAALAYKELDKRRTVRGNKSAMGPGGELTNALCCLCIYILELLRKAIQFWHIT